LETARKTLDKTTQVAVRNFTESMGRRRLKPIHYQLKYRRLRCERYVDVYIVKCKSLRGNKVATVSCTPFHWIRFDPTPERRDAHKTLDSLFQPSDVHWEKSPTHDPYEASTPHDPAEKKEALPELEEADEIQYERCLVEQS